jgi:hypothetical protein
MGFVVSPARFALHYAKRTHKGCMYTKNTPTRKRKVIDEPVASLDMGACRAAATTSLKSSMGTM